MTLAMPDYLKVAIKIRECVNDFGSHLHVNDIHVTLILSIITLLLFDFEEHYEHVCIQLGIHKNTQIFQVHIIWKTIDLFHNYTEQSNIHTIYQVHGVK